MEKSIKSILDEISNESSTNLKMEILKKYKNNELLKRVLYLALSSRVKFYIKQIPPHSVNSVTYPLSNGLDLLSKLSSRELTGGDASIHLKMILENCNPNDQDVIKRIIEKDIRIGMGTTNINKIINNLVEKTPYMGAKPYDKKLVEKLFTGTKPVIAQIKMDGRYSNSIIRNGEVDLESRGGEPTFLQGAKFIEELKTFPDCVLNGELVIKGINRYESNGIIASLISINKKKREGEDVSKEISKFEQKHMDYYQAMDSIQLVCWDIITFEEYISFESKVEYDIRLRNLKNVLNRQDITMVSVVEGKIVSSIEEAMEYFVEALKRKEEGLILKSFSNIYKHGKPNTQIKLKKEINLDLQIIGFNYGTGKNSNLISSVDCQTSDGLLLTSPTGINEKEMEFITNNQDKLLNTIIEIKCSGLSQDGDNNWSVLHPVYKIRRDDKNIANSLQECIKIEQSTTFL